MTDLPITPESVAHLPDAPRDPEDATAIGPLSAHVTILSRAKPTKRDNEPSTATERAKS